MAYEPIQNFSYESQLSPQNGAPDHHHQEEHHSADVGDASMYHHNPEEVMTRGSDDDQNTTVSIELEAVERSWNDAALLTAKSTGHARVHSGSSDFTLGKGTTTSSFIGVSALKLPPNEKGDNGPARPWNKDGTWTVEIVTMFVSLAALAAIIGLIAHYDRRALTEWPYRITLNAVIAVLATMSVTTLGISLQNGLSQMKWIRFKESKVPLADMETFDEASRGVLGAIKLLASRRGGLLGSAGALIAILTLAFSPFSQQIVTYEMRAVNHPLNATIPRALNFTGALPGTTSPTGYVPVLPIKSAVYNGLFAENGRPAASLKFDCPTGNCTWPEFETLGVCYECTSLTSVMTKYCGGNPANASDCGWQVPQGAKLNTSHQVFSMTPYIPAAAGDMPYSTILRLIFLGTEAADGPPGNNNPWARQCSLSACLQTINATVAVGALTENVTHTVVNQTVVDTTTQPNNTDLGVYVADHNKTSSLPSPSSPYYLLGQDSMLSLRGWFTTLFAAGGATRTTNNSTMTINDRTVAVNLTVGISNGTTFFDSDIVTAFYWNYYEYAAARQDGIAMLMADTATSITTAFRSLWGAEPVAGPAVSTESYIHVRWGFLVLPLLVVLGADAFLIGAIYQTHKTRTRPLKSSALAMLFHGLEDDTRARFGSTDSLQEKKRQAKTVRVQLDESNERGSLLRS
ncbi:Carboxylic ester hydrolase [Apiospora saccharicola]|uniref:Carboxylic ester hydrolase n=1 Tax=Apiospora saccharicola TaxID=335842 RepID=A0ABR1WJK3_9PEZI